MSTLLNGRYRLETEIGRGGMGIVYRAHDTLLGRDVAAKILSSSDLGSQGRARLLHEAQAAARLNHPNIITVYDAGETEKTPFIIMELLTGHSLYERKPATLNETLNIMKQVCHALHHAHAHGIIHRDLKLENIIVTPKGIAKLTDFGLARSLTSRMSIEGAITGTVFYLSPEQIMGREVDGRSDLYALGVMLYELSAGQLPFNADEPLAVISQHLHAPPIPPSSHNPAISPALESLILRLLQKERQDRPAVAAEVAQALADLTESAVATPAVVLPVSPLERLARERLVAREEEMAEARRLWKQVITGNHQQPVLFISGEPGVGKTPFVRELTTLAEVSGGNVLVGECYAGGTAPYAPIAQIIRQALILLTGETAVPVAASPEAPSASLPLPELVMADLARLTPELQIRYGHALPHVLPEPASQEHRLFESVVTLGATLVERAPLMLVVEDVHWADSGTLYLLRHLARRVRAAGLRLLIVMTYRDVELDAACCLDEVMLDFNREQLTARIKLGRYDREQTRSVLASIFQEEIEDEFLDAIYRETEGNLFFIEELAKSLVESGQVYRDNGRWRRSGMHEIQLPQSVRGAILARVQRLSPEAQEVLRLAAIIGREFDFETLCQASDLEEELLIDALETAEGAQLIREVKTSRRAAQETFAFAHALTVATLRENLSSLRRHRLHRRVAAVIAAQRPDDYESLAYHYEEAGDVQSALKYQIKAGDRALSVYANKEAERHYRAALELSESGPQQAQLLAGLGEALFRQSHFKQAAKTWRSAINRYQALQDLDNVARYYARMARAIWYVGDTERSLLVCREGMERLAEQPESPGLALLLHETGRACHFNDLADEAAILCQQALDLAERLELVEVQAETLATLGILSNQTPETRLTTLTRAVDLAESAGLVDVAMRAHTNLAHVLRSMNDLPTARQHFQRIRELAQETGNLAWQTKVLFHEATVAFSLGELKAVEAMLPSIRHALQAAPESVMESFILAFLEAALLRVRGNLHEAVHSLQALQQVVRQRGQRQFLKEANYELADVYLELGQPDAAETALLELMPANQEQPLVDGAVEVLCTLSRVELHRGRLAEARHKLDAAQVLFQQTPDPLVKDHLTWVSARLAAAEGKWSDAFAAFAAAGQSLANRGVRWYHARLLMEWGDAHAARSQSGDLAQAEQLWTRAQAIFTEMDAAYYAAQAQQRVKNVA